VRFALTHNVCGGTGEERETAGSLTTLGMTTRKAKAKGKSKRQKQIPCGNDKPEKQKQKSRTLVSYYYSTSRRKEETMNTLNMPTMPAELKPSVAFLPDVSRS
jgi:hypothetical protein